jgi:hypothetical protein
VGRRGRSASSIACASRAGAGRGHAVAVPRGRRVAAGEIGRPLAAPGLPQPRQPVAHFGGAGTAPPEQIEGRIVEPQVLPPTDEDGASRRPHVIPPAEPEQRQRTREGGRLAAIHVHSGASEQPAEPADIGQQHVAAHGRGTERRVDRVRLPVRRPGV